MEPLKYKVIVNQKQYSLYCNQLEQLVFSKSKNRSNKEEIALLTVLIEKWDEEHSNRLILDPVQVLISLMKEHQLKSKDLVEILSISKGAVSEILHYKKGFSKEVIRKLSDHFKVSQEAFNRPYNLIHKTSAVNSTKP